MQARTSDPFLVRPDARKQKQPLQLEESDLSDAESKSLIEDESDSEISDQEIQADESVTRMIAHPQSSVLTAKSDSISPLNAVGHSSDPRSIRGGTVESEDILGTSLIDDGPGQINDDDTEATDDELDESEEGSVSEADVGDVDEDEMYDEDAQADDVEVAESELDSDFAVSESGSENVSSEEEMPARRNSTRKTQSPMKGSARSIRRSKQSERKVSPKKNAKSTLATNAAKGTRPLGDRMSQDRAMSGGEADPEEEVLAKPKKKR